MLSLYTAFVFTEKEAELKQYLCYSVDTVSTIKVLAARLV